jgi:iron complex outermembrane receptor protein
MAKPSVRAVVQGLLATAAYVTATAVFAAAPVANEVHSWNIPSEDGPSAVRDFGIQSGVAISAVQTDLQGLKLNAVSGSMSVDQALKLLVAGTGLKYVYDASGRAVTLTTAAKPAAAKTQAGPVSTKADPPPTVDDAVLVEEIVVTARKREENLQEVPISAQVISGEALKLITTSARSPSCRSRSPEFNSTPPPRAASFSSVVSDRARALRSTNLSAPSSTTSFTAAPVSRKKPFSISIESKC